MRNRVPHLGHFDWNRARDLVGPIVCWTVWSVMTVALMFFVRHYTRNVPYMDDVSLIEVMTGSQAVDFEWLWSQHNEHRPLISPLILAGLTRYVRNDFRTGLYFNAAMMSIAAATMLLLARKLRGSTRITDSVLPLSILTISQTESITIAFALNLVLTAWIAYELLALVSLAGRRSPQSLAMKFGLYLVLLPLTGGGGLAMLPPLALWLIGYLCWKTWSGRELVGAGRAIAIGLLIACAEIVGLYFVGYVKPAHHPPAPSVAAAAYSALECLSLAVNPSADAYWWPSGLLVAFLSVATLVRLAIVGLGAPRERDRAFGLCAIILAMLSTAVAVGLSRSGFGPGACRAFRYITLMAPLLSSLYISWLLYASDRIRRCLFAGLLALTCLMVPQNVRRAVHAGERLCAVERGVERSLAAKLPASQLIRRAHPTLHPDAYELYKGFLMLKTARFGAFQDFVNDRMAAVAEGSAVRR